MTVVAPETGTTIPAAQKAMAELSAQGVVGMSSLDFMGRAVVNTSDVPTSELVENASFREMASQVTKWVENARAATGKNSMFDRGAYTPPENPYDEMRSARNAVKFDSIVAGVAEITESFAFQGVKWESPDPDEADCFNQLATDQNLDGVVRAMWREEFTYASATVAALWGWANYTVRGRTKKGNQRKKSFRVWAPLKLIILDPMKVVPVGAGALAGEQLCWSSTNGELSSWNQAVQGDLIDPLMLSFFTGTYVPGYEEAGMLGRMGVDPNRLLTMNPDWVFRHTLTKPDYEHFPDNRLKSCFRLLDMKQALMSADRAALIGSANYILLIQKGSKEQPALPEEMQTLRENYNYLAKMPVIISDHRLNIEIISPKTDFTLTHEKYQTLDEKITQRLLGTLSSGSGGRSSSSSHGGESSLAESVGRVMENRRHMLRRTLELRIARAIVRHPKNAGVFNYEPNLVYTPRNIALSQLPGYLQSLLALRTQRELSRETILEVFGLDEETEAMRMQMEAELFDDIFKTEVPYTSTGLPAEDKDRNLSGGESDDSGGMSLTAAPDGTLKVQPKGSGSSTSGASTPVATKAPAKKAPAKALPAASGQGGGRGTGATRTPNGAPESPAVSGRRGGRPVGGGSPAKSPAKLARPTTRTGVPKT